ncbi:hypothetical protein PHLGIDRAFT_24778 [Phlebiopsis gigantea 11061_1 CR5-6]|uniref:Yeast cell wall synthesis Kre9/Knh1-like N-terminal domain-containing protein n=1 Tax=Phlebiopsis gigantea (strain 11061_1 CR5-6) TaxID=745531 RepID=A0A0C3PJ10_PHLG1|nr:hypothetical protein PHLGIDRAFT_24778 [Phlebiopsis gigantea 11061_1 CR5-6]
MKFTTPFAAALGAASQLQARDIWDPKMTYPTTGTVWTSGQPHTVTWETADAPPSNTGEGKAHILLRSGDFKTPAVLVHDMDLRVGQANVVVSDVITGEDFSLILFGDSDNWGDTSTINGPVPT